MESREKMMEKVGKALGDVTRIRMLMELSERLESNMTELAEVVEVPLSTVSHHVGVLEGVGAVEVEPVGREKMVRLADWMESVMGRMNEVFDFEEGDFDDYAR